MENNRNFEDLINAINESAQSFNRLSADLNDFSLKTEPLIQKKTNLKKSSSKNRAKNKQAKKSRKINRK